VTAVDRDASPAPEGPDTRAPAHRMWDDAIDRILEHDLIAALGYVTPAGGVVVAPVAPIGIRSRDEGSVGFTTSLGFGRKLDRLRADPRVALAYHTRQHGVRGSVTDEYVLVHGTARFDASPSRAQHDAIRAQATPYTGPALRGPFWDRWLAAYYSARVQVSIDVERIVTWRDLTCGGQPTIAYGAPQSGPPAPQSPPRKGTAPRIDLAKPAKRLKRVPYRLLGYRGADGYPMIVPVDVGDATQAGLRIGCAAELPRGGRRAGLVGHSFRARAVGLECRQYTGWLEDGVFSPFTESGFVAPPNRTVLMLVNGFKAQRGLRRSRRRLAEQEAAADPKASNAVG